jgi:hypothetical protein
MKEKNKTKNGESLLCSLEYKIKKKSFYVILFLIDTIN